jgi:hypothetical protein
VTAEKSLRNLLAEYDEAWNLFPSSEKLSRTIRVQQDLGGWVVQNRDRLLARENEIEDRTLPVTADQWDEKRGETL